MIIMFQWVGLNDDLPSKDMYIVHTSDLEAVAKIALPAGEVIGQISLLIHKCQIELRAVISP